jgi:hypothetical protein
MAQLVHWHPTAACQCSPLAGTRARARAPLLNPLPQACDGVQQATRVCLPGCHQGPGHAAARPHLQGDEQPQPGALQVAVSLLCFGGTANADTVSQRLPGVWPDWRAVLSPVLYCTVLCCLLMWPHASQAHPQGRARLQLACAGGGCAAGPKQGDVRGVCQAAAHICAVPAPPVISSGRGHSNAPAAFLPPLPPTPAPRVSRWCRPRWRAQLTAMVAGAPALAAWTWTPCFPHQRPQQVSS